MPRKTRAYGRPGTRVIPTDWAESHGKVIAKTWTAEGEIRGPRNAGDGYTVSADLSITDAAEPGAPLYAGAMRIQQLNAQETRSILGDQEQITAGYLVVIDRDALIPIRSVITVTSTSDTALTTRRLVVRKVGKGSEVWERDLYAVEDLTAPDPD